MADADAQHSDPALFIITVSRFPLGQLVATANASATLTREDIQKAISQHASGQWGDLCKDDWDANEQALAEGGRLLSVYHSEKGVKFYIITEWDRSVTTVLLPEDY